MRNNKYNIENQHSVDEEKERKYRRFQRSEAHDRTREAILNDKNKAFIMNANSNKSKKNNCRPFAKNPPKNEIWVDLDFMLYLKKLLYFETLIPGDKSQSKKKGYADIIDPEKNTIYEVKDAKLKGGADNQLNWYIKNMKFSCNWDVKKGEDYPNKSFSLPKVIPHPSIQMIAWQPAPGIILYRVSDKKNPSPQPSLAPLPDFSKKWKSIMKSL